MSNSIASVDQQVAHEVHCAVVVLIECVELDEGIEREEIGTGAARSLPGAVRCQRAGLPRAVLDLGQLDDPSACQ